MRKFPIPDNVKSSLIKKKNRKGGDIFDLRKLHF